jgi:hypothetical protein
MAEFAFFVGPGIPYLDLVFIKVTGVGVSAEKPEQLMDDGRKVELFGSKKWKALLQVVAGLVAEYTQGAGAGPGGFPGTVAKDVFKEIKILLHSDFSFQAARACQL